MNSQNAQSVFDTVFVGRAAPSNWPMVLYTSHLHLLPAAPPDRLTIKDSGAFTFSSCCVLSCRPHLWSVLLRKRAFFFFLTMPPQACLKIVFAGWTWGLASKTVIIICSCINVWGHLIKFKWNNTMLPFFMELCGPWFHIAFKIKHTIQFLYNL